MRFAHRCAQHLRHSLGREDAVELLRQRMEHGSAEDRSIYADILAALRPQEQDDGSR